jgi:hypothetical protein
MLERILGRIREKIRRRDYVVTLHARKEMNEDDLTVYDVEHVILTGEIVERQQAFETVEVKYRVQGQAIAGAGAEVVLKISSTGKVVVITVYLSED